MKKGDEIILEKQISKIKLNEGELEIINSETDEIINEIKKSLKKRKIKAEVFLGGSLAKGTLIRKKDYDIDIFVRFHEDKNISERLSSVINAERVHGSRDYFRIRKKNILFEIIPVLKINKPEEAKNITDLSYFHVGYVLNETKKNKKLADEIMLAKCFCFAQRCYGAESYVKGFSGYALELLVSHYGSFTNFIKEIIKEKIPIVIDPKKFYKDEDDVLNQLNESKLQSPIVFVDPTYKQRNSLAALSNETFEKFKQACSDFLKKPSEKFFEEKKIDEKKFNLVLEASTDRQEGDIAGSKLLKFSRLVSSKLERYFKIKNEDFDYLGKRAGRLYFKIEKRKDIIYSGPPINKPERLLSFKQAHKKVFIKNHVAFAIEKSISFKEFFSKFLKENKKVMKEMGITKLKIIKS
ncbi:MAG: nucleotidyltransferase domain-containing protein [Nanoarchaeota archaeon]